MKLILRIFIVAILLCSIGCSSRKHYSSTMFSEAFLANKTVVFTLNEKSFGVGLLREGPRMGIEVAPDIKKAFKRSVEDLANEIKRDLKFSDSSNSPGENQIHIDVTVTQMKWTFTIWSATMKSYLTYDIVDSDSQYESIGTFTNASGGSENNNLYKSFKNANYLLLKELEKNNEIKQ